MFVKRKRGSVTVEAGILLPLVIIGILTLAFLIKVIYFQEMIFHTLVNEARKTSTEAYLYELKILSKGLAGELLSIGPQNYLIFESRIHNSLLNDSEKNPQNLKINQFRYLYCEKGIEDLIKIQLSYSIKLSLPIGYVRSVNIVQGVLMRAWTGIEEYRQPMPFAFMEKVEKSRTVFVFPRKGERYHKRECSFISSQPSMEMLSDAIRNSFEPCAVCDASEKPKGSIIFCFKEYGKAYHSSDCPIVDKYIIEIEVSEAEKKGYQACSKCGGGE